MSEKERLKLLLLEGEGLTVEFKERLANLDREVVAFANAGGGSIFLGIDDEGHVKGIEMTNRLQSQIHDISRNCDPSIKIEIIAYAQDHVIEVKIEEGDDKPYRCKDGFFLRVGPSSQKLRRDEIITLINDSGKITFDYTVNKQFNYPSDFSEETLRNYLKECGIKTDASAKDVLLSLNVAVEKNNLLIFNNAGVLFFAKNPQKFFPESYITCVTYKTYDRYSIFDKKDCLGSPTKQISEALAYLIRHTSAEAIIDPIKTGLLGQRIDVYDYPIEALREAVINAVVHRDYLYDASHIYIHMYPDRIEIQNPGGLYKGLTMENIGNRSARRNKLIADLLHRSGHIEAVGTGLDRMSRALEENNNPAFEIIPTNFFDIKFYKRIKTDSVLNKLSLRQVKIYTLIKEKENITKRDGAIFIGVSEATALRELNVLIKHDLIQRKGTGRSAYYTLRKKGVK